MPSGDVGEISLRDNCLQSRHFSTNLKTAANGGNGDGIPAGCFAANVLDKGDLALTILQWVDVLIANAALDTLNATPVSLVAAPGSGKALLFAGALVVNNFVTAALELGSGTLDIKYQNSSGGLAGQMTNAFVESAATAYAAVAPLTCVALVNQALVLHASADITSGGGNLAIRMFYRTVTIAAIA